MRERVAICTPVRDLVHAGFTFDLARLVQAEPEAIFALGQGVYLPNLRNGLAAAALGQGFDAVLFLDSDIRFPPDTVRRLLKADKPIVGANYLQRTKRVWTALRDCRPFSSDQRTGLEKVDALGMGVTLVRTGVFDAMPMPWFATPWDGLDNSVVGEDVFFCQMARRAGFTVWVDHDLSQQVRHAGLVEFGPDTHDLPGMGRGG